MNELNAISEPVARLLLYRFLARCYTYPEPDFARHLCQPELWQRLRMAGQALSPAVRRQVESLEAVACRPGGRELPQIDLEIEYTHLFVNAVPHLPAPLYESAYRDEGLLMGEAVSQVLRAYGEAGLAMRQGELLPDHLVAELEFMAYLAWREAEAGRASSTQVPSWKTRQERFLAAHLLRWSPTFLSRVVTHARHAFYLKVADLTTSLLCFEQPGFCLSRSVARGNP